MKSFGLAAVAVLVMMACAASADYIDWPVKWSQTPWDFNGSDWPSDERPWITADDFMCEDEDMIYAVRWWGSYIGDQNQHQDGWVFPVHIRFYLSAGSHSYSLPGAEVFYDEVEAQEVFVGRDHANEPVYRYDAYLTKPFDQWYYSQQSPNKGELFIGITIVQPSWGWHEVIPPHPILDFAAIWDGAKWNSTETDTAFELMTVPEPGTLAGFALALPGIALGRGLVRKR
jgi:hypothetical protein